MAAMPILADLAVTAAMQDINVFRDKVPNEIFLSIVFYLSKADLKRLRIVCKKFASRGGQILVVNLYLSPREKDMEVFDAVTRHPDLKISVKNIIFDSAQFVKYTLSQYLMKLNSAYIKGRFTELGSAGAAVADVLSKCGPILPDDVDDILDKEEILRHPVLMQGYQQYTLHAQEQGNIFLSSWYTRAFEGLSRLGPIRSAAIRNSWEMMYMLSQDEGIGSFTKEFRSDLVRLDGTRAVGSPSARAWLPTTLQPSSPKSTSDNQTSISALMSTGRSTGFFEFVEFTKLLDTTGKQPMELQAKGNWPKNIYTGLPLSAFGSERSPQPTHFLSLCNHLKILDLRLGIYLDLHSEWFFPELDILQEVFKRAQSLGILKLSLGYDGSVEYYAPFLDFAAVFPSTTTLTLPNLTTLDLDAFVFAYCDLASFLFLSLPKLTSLGLRRARLWDGHWQDIVEGLRCFKDINRCEFDEALLYEDGEYYRRYKDIYMDSEELADFMIQNEQYVMKELHRHPKLKGLKPDSASTKYLDRLNETLDKIRASKT
ncbi:MAG: hypothetical protein Q9226_006372 [Calogaya cf. arnoldii]